MAERLINNQRPGHSDRGKDKPHLTHLHAAGFLGFARVRCECVRRAAIETSELSSWKAIAPSVRKVGHQ